MNDKPEAGAKIAVIAGNHSGADIAKVITALRVQGMDVVTEAEATHLLEGKELDRTVELMHALEQQKAVRKLGELGVDRNARRSWGINKAKKKAKLRELQARAFKGE